VGDGVRILVCGGRDYADAEKVRGVLGLYKHRQPTLVHGDCAGADRLADWTARVVYGWQTERHPANWRKHGRGAGPARNERMARLGADVLLAFPGGRGTEDMVRRAEAHGIPVRKIA